MLDGAAGLTAPRVGDSKAARGGRLSAPIADLSDDGEALLEEFDGAAGFAERRVGDAEVSRSDCLSTLIAALSVDDEAMLVESDGAPGLAEIRLGEAERRLDQPQLRRSALQPGGI